MPSHEHTGNQGGRKDLPTARDPNPLTTRPTSPRRTAPADDAALPDKWGKQARKTQPKRSGEEDKRRRRKRRNVRSLSQQPKKGGGKAEPSGGHALSHVRRHSLAVSRANCHSHWAVRASVKSARLPFQRRSLAASLANRGSYWAACASVKGLEEKELSGGERGRRRKGVGGVCCHGESTPCVASSVPHARPLLMGEGGDKMVADCYSCYLQGLNKAAKKPQAPSSKPEEAKGPQLTKEAPPGEPPPPLLENPREGLGDLLDVQLVGQDYVEEVLNNKYNMVCFHCKLCECSFNDPKAKDMHLKGRQHHLQYKGFPAELQKHSSSSVDAMVPRGFGEIGRDQAQQPDSDVAGGPLAPGGRAALAPGNEARPTPVPLECPCGVGSFPSLWFISFFLDPSPLQALRRCTGGRWKRSSSSGRSSSGGGSWQLTGTPLPSWAASETPSLPSCMPCGCLLSTKSTGSWAWICWRQQSTG
ncbi:uncharacterized protein [Anolis sagrei]|uniref:uncharacterized protein n=1 Tax=Anolis sagrei TaxID=38937 RepID=UPI003522F156